MRRDAEENRRRVLEAAGRLMAERGLQASLDDIAAEAGVGIATLYRRFPSRDELVAALFDDRLAEYVADLEATFEIDDGWEALVWFLRRSIARQIADRGLKELLGGEGQLQEVLALAERVVERARGQMRGDVAVGDLAMLTEGLVAIGVAAAPVDPRQWERQLSIVLDGLRADGQAPGEALSHAGIQALRGTRPPG